MRERPFLLATLVEDNSDSSLSHTLEENKNRVNGERGEKRKTAGLVYEEEERRRQRKAAKKAKKEKERLQASTRMATPVKATNHMTAGSRLLDVVARLVSRKSSSGKEEQECPVVEDKEEISESSSGKEEQVCPVVEDKEETSESKSGKGEQEYPVVEDISYEQVQEEAGRCSHGPPTDYPCHICCYNKWTMTRRLEQPGVEKAEGNLGAASGDHDVTMIEATNEPLAGGNSAETRENLKSTKTKREHSEEGGRDHGADILFDGTIVGPLGCKAKKIHDEVKNGEKPNVIKGLATTVKAAKGSIKPHEEDQVKNIVKSTKWAEVFRSSGVTISKAP